MAHPFQDQNPYESTVVKAELVKRRKSAIDLVVIAAAIATLVVAAAVMAFAPLPAVWMAMAFVAAACLVTIPITAIIAVIRRL